MSKDNHDIQTDILLAALEEVPFDGWQWAIVERAAEMAGYDRAMAEAVFPSRLPEVLIFFSNWADQAMLMELKSVDGPSLRVRDRIRLAVETRIKILTPHKEAVKAAAAFWAHPLRKAQALRTIWQSCDVIWKWAGDTATDYNRYTKRGLLAGVLGATMLFWFQDQSSDYRATFAFLERRIENVMGMGKFLSQFPLGKKRKAAS